MKLIDYHKRWVENGNLSKSGLCASLPKKYKKLFELFYPIKLSELCVKTTYWAAPEIKFGESGRSYTYTPTRQHIVLFICAMCGEI
jgi:hypothetical protein